MLALDYEIEVATLATTPGVYASGHVLALAGGTKWSSSTGTPVTDIRAAADVVRKKIGKRPNRLTLSADALSALSTNPEVKGYLPNSNLGPASIEQLKVILNVEQIIVGDAV
ncbi:Phage major capsid protein E [Paracidovorax valerianellae]|uniref:Phage major capsid protein E n=1 Tax=Paracidovorax valerianellae TaxID=187868 RepID=A0A1G7EJF8_9BURK|nr:Phage major capsid protein E [Paracidovorax valerianellae]